MFRNYSKYDVYPDGRIWSYSHKKFLKPGTTKDGYQVVVLTDNEGNAKMYYLHRVVWEAVTGSPIPKGYEINHIDERKDNNARSNLDIVSHKENLNYGSRNARASKTKSKQVGAFNKNGELVLTFQSTQEARRNGFVQSAVSACCRGEKKTHRGFEWRYI